MPHATDHTGQAIWGHGSGHGVDGWVSAAAAVRRWVRMPKRKKRDLDLLEENREALEEDGGVDRGQGIDAAEGPGLEVADAEVG